MKYHKQERKPSSKMKAFPSVVGLASKTKNDTLELPNFWYHNQLYNDSDDTSPSYLQSLTIYSQNNTYGQRYTLYHEKFKT